MHKKVNPRTFFFHKQTPQRKNKNYPFETHALLSASKQALPGLPQEGVKSSGQLNNLFNNGEVKGCLPLPCNVFRGVYI